MAQPDRKERGVRYVDRLVSAQMQLRLAPDRIPWLYATLQNQPEVQLLNGALSEPFSSLAYVASLQGDQLRIMIGLGLEPIFSEQNGTTVGSPDVLEPFLKRYPEHKFINEGQGLLVMKDGEVHGMIIRPQEGLIVIQRGAQAGLMPVSAETPVNDLSTHLDRTHLLAQRYVGAIWGAQEETAHRRLHVVLDIPALPDGASATYYSTFEIIGSEFRVHPRAIDLDTKIGGYPRIKATIKALFMDLTQPEVSRQFGTQPFSNKLVLVCGGEGRGKSLFTKALEAMFRKEYGDGFEHFRLPFADILTKYGPQSVTIVKTILDHIKENEKNSIPTLLHLDGLEHLIHQFERDNFTSNYSPAELAYAIRTINPVVVALGDFGHELGGNSHHVIVFGESRVPYEYLPEVLARIFRRRLSLDNPTLGDNAEILRVQIETTREFASKTGRDPFVQDIESQIPDIANFTYGLTGREIEQVLIDIATQRKADWDGETYEIITADKLASELKTAQLSKGFSVTIKSDLFGFGGMVERQQMKPNL